MKSVRLNDGLEVLGERWIVDWEEVEGRVFAGSSVEPVRLPSTLKRIEAMMFQGCKCLKSIVIPNSVEYIGKNCFFESAVVKIRLPKNGVKVGEGAFKCPVHHVLMFQGDVVRHKFQ